MTYKMNLLQVVLLLAFVVGATAQLHAQSAYDISNAQYDELKQALFLGELGNPQLSQAWGNKNCYNYTICPAQSDYVCRHPGVDFGVALDTPVYTPVSGVVTNRIEGTDCQQDKCLSEFLIYNAELNKTFVFLHMRSFLFNIGDQVQAGMQIGTSGQRGRASAPHLHYEVRLGTRTLASVCITGTLNPYRNTPHATTNTQAPFWDFNVNGNRQGWNAFNISAVSVNSSIFFVDFNGAGDPHIESPDINVSAAAYPYVSFKMASNLPDGNGYVYFRTQAHNSYSETMKVPFTASHCGAGSSCYGNAPFVNYPVKMSDSLSWTGNITGIRIDPADTGEGGTNRDTVGFDNIGFAAPITTLGEVDPSTTPPWTDVTSVYPQLPLTNQASTVTTSITNYDGDAFDALIDIEIYDSANRRVAQQFIDHQDLLSGSSYSFTANWIPATSGHYQARVGVYKSNWTVNYYWDETALSFTVNDAVASPTPTPTSTPANPAFSSTASAVPSPATVNQPVTISATVTNSGGGASDVIVDVEVYDATNTKVFQNFTEHQNFAANSSQIYMQSWTPSASGQYTAKIGIFSNNWGTNYSWNGGAAIISVNPASPPPASNIDIWWPSDGAQVSGTQPFKAVVGNLSLSQYNMSWQVDGGGLVPMADSYQDAPHKEASVDLSGWTWRGVGPYSVNFVVKDGNGNTIAQRAVSIYVFH